MLVLNELVEYNTVVWSGHEWSIVLETDATGQDVTVSVYLKRKYSSQAAVSSYCPTLAKILLDGPKDSDVGKLSTSVGVVSTSRNNSQLILPVTVTIGIKRKVVIFLLNTSGDIHQLVTSGWYVVGRAPTDPEAFFVGETVYVKHDLSDIVPEVQISNSVYIHESK